LQIYLSLLKTKIRIDKTEYSFSINCNSLINLNIILIISLCYVYCDNIEYVALIRIILVIKESSK